MSAIPQITEPVIAQDAGLKCPRCSGIMYWRQNRGTGAFFMGCRFFPQCQGTRTQDGSDSTITNTTNEKRLARLLKAAILAAEDECLTFKESELQRVDEFQLNIEHIREEDSYVVTVVKK